MTSTPVKLTTFPTELFHGPFERLQKVFEEAEFRQNSSLPINHYNEVIEGNKVAECIEIAAAGFSKNDISIKIENRNLSVSIKKEEKDDFHKEFITYGISTRSYKSQWVLGPTVDIENITSKFQDGLLLIRVPVKVPEKVTVDIEVQ